MILGFPTARKTPQDVITVACDWTRFLPLTQGATSIVSHSIAVDLDIPDAAIGGFGDSDFITIGTAGVTAVDGGVVGFVQSVQLSGGLNYAYSIVALTVTFNEGTQLSRSFKVLVR